jgi:ketosteroid isomerase-like protein
MSQENVETARRSIEFWVRRDFSSLAEVVDPDAVFDVSRNVFNPGVHRGIEGFKQFVEQVDEMWEEFEAKPDELIDAGDRIIAGMRISGKGRDGVDVEMLTFGIWTFRGGKIVRYEGGYRDRSEALKAAELSE